MLNELGKLVEAFPGAPNQARCFLHILNLVAKSVMHQFDPPNAKTGNLVDEAVSDWQHWQKS